MAKFVIALALLALCAVAYGQLIGGGLGGVGLGLGRVGGLGLVGGRGGGWGGWANSWVSRQQVHSPGWGWGRGGAGIGAGGIGVGVVG